MRARSASRARSGSPPSSRASKRERAALAARRPPAADRAPRESAPARPARWRRRGGAAPRSPRSRRAPRGTPRSAAANRPSARNAIARSCARTVLVSGSRGMDASGPALYRLAPKCRRRRARIACREPDRAGAPPPRFFAPEVIQTSAMDCGPAALKCLLEGFGVRVSYGRLREACQTSVDGTSIDTLETLAQSLGLDAEQVMMPVDHLLRRRRPTRCRRSWWCGCRRGSPTSSSCGARTAAGCR